MANMMNEPLNNDYPTYKEQVDKLHKLIQDKDRDSEIRGKALEWFSEFNEAFYPIMCKIVDELESIDEEDFMEEDDAGISDEQQEFIKWVGELLHKRGGFQTQQSMFYIMSNIMGCRRVFVLKYLWNGIGDWKQ